MHIQSLRRALFAAIIAVPQADAQTPAPAPAIEKVVLADNIYLFRAPSDLDKWTSSNSVVIVNETDVTVFDSNTLPSTTALVLAEIRKVTNKPVRTLINSHWHMDHWLGNQVYARAFPDIRIISTTETREFMRRMPIQYFVGMTEVTARRAALDSAVKTGKLADGSALTATTRKQMEADVAEVTTFANEIASVTQTFPTYTFSDSLTLWSGTREFKLFSATGDASGSTVLYLPREKMLVTGDVLVRREDGTGAQPWTTNSYKITPWLQSLRQLNALDVAIIVPGQGPAMRDKAFLEKTVALYTAVVGGVHAALEAGALSLAEVQAKVNLDAIRVQLTAGNADLDAAFRAMTARLIQKTYLEAHDGVVRAP